MASFPRFGLPSVAADRLRRIGRLWVLVALAGTAAAVAMWVSDGVARQSGRGVRQRPDLEAWVGGRSAETGEAVEEIVDRAVAAHRDRLGASGN